MKDILTTALGIMLFGDSDTSRQALAGIGAGLVGGMAYSYFSYCDMNQEPVASGPAQDEKKALSVVTKHQELSCQDVESPSSCTPLIKAHRPVWGTPKLSDMQVR